MNDSDTTIINGKDADITSFPYQAAILDSHYTQYCGGVIIANRYVITAQHCVNIDEGGVYVGVGKTRVSEFYSGSGTYAVQHIVNYPRYKQAWNGKDFSVLVLNQALTFNTRIKSIAMATSALPHSYIAPNAEATVSGWGSLNRAGTNYPDRLQTTKIYFTNPALATKRAGPLTPDEIAAGIKPSNG